MEEQNLTEERFANVFEALCDNPAEAANLAARGEIMIALHERIATWALSQQAAANRLGITRPRLNDLLRGKIDRFSLDALINIADRAGFRVKLVLEDARAA